PITGSRIVMGSGLSGAADAAQATRQACAEAQAGLGDARPTVVLLFYCGSHVAEAQRIADAARDAFSGALTIGTPAESIIGGRVELERGPGVSVLAARLAGARAEPFEAAELFPVDTTDAGTEHMRDLIGASADDPRATFLF